MLWPRGTDQGDLTTGNACWETAPKIYEAIANDFGPFDIDNGSTMGYGRIAYNRRGLRAAAFANVLDGGAIEYEVERCLIESRSQNVGPAELQVLVDIRPVDGVQVEYVEVEGSGHSVYFEDAAAFNQHCVG